MLFDYKDILSNTYIVGGFTSLLAYIGASFLKPKLAEFIQSLISFIFLNYKHWLYFIFITLILYYFFKVQIDLAFIVSVIIVCIVSFFSEFGVRTKAPTLLYLGTFYENEKSFLNKNIQTEKIDTFIHEEIEKFNSYSYLIKQNVLEVKEIKLPKFYVITKTFTGLNVFFKKIIKKNLAFGFAFFLSPEGMGYKSFLNTSNLNTSSTFKDNIDSINDILESKNLTDREKVSLAVKINLMVITQSFNDMFLDFKEFSFLKFALEDNQKLINDVKKVLSDKQISIKSVDNLISNFQCSYFRYMAILEFNKNNSKLGVDYIFKSLELNPFFPCENYDEFKNEFSTRDYLELISSFFETSEYLDNKDNNYGMYAELENLRDKLLLRQQQVVILFTLDIFKGHLIKIFENDIIDGEAANDLVCYIETKLKALDDTNNIAELLLRLEILKILPKGEEKINLIYTDRLEECIQTLQKITITDPAFPLIHRKIGTLKFLLGMHKDDEELTQDGIKSLNIGFEELKAIGVDLTNNNE